MFRFTIRDVLWLMVVVGLGVLSFFTGALWGVLRNDAMRGNNDVALVNDLLSAHPARLDSLTINRGPAGKFVIQGTVKTQADLDFLRDELIQVFGRERVRYVFGVEVREPSQSQ